MLQHGDERLRKRCGINKKSLERVKSLALERGLTHKEATGSLKRYFDKLYFNKKTANNIRLYANHVFIFKSKQLITVFEIPRTLKMKAINQLKNKEKNESGKLNYRKTA